MLHAPAAARSLPLVVLGLALAGCGEEEDTADTGADTGFVLEPEYGVAATSAPAPQPAGQSSSTTEKRPKS